MRILLTIALLLCLIPPALARNGSHEDEPQPWTPPHGECHLPGLCPDGDVGQPTTCNEIAGFIDFGACDDEPFAGSFNCDRTVMDGGAVDVNTAACWYAPGGRYSSPPVGWGYAGWSCDAFGCSFDAGGSCVEVVTSSGPFIVCQ
jgi:hypothetical protein